MAIKAGDNARTSGRARASRALSRVARDLSRYLPNEERTRRLQLKRLRTFGRWAHTGRADNEPDIFHYMCLHCEFVT